MGSKNPFLRFPRTALGLAVLLSLFLAMQWGRLDIHTETDVLLESDPRNQASFEKVMDILEKDVVLVVDLECRDVFSPECIRVIDRLSRAFRGQPGFVDVKSLTHSYKPVRDGLGFSMVPLVSAGTADTKELEQLRHYALENPLLRNVMVSGDARHTVLTVTYRRDLSTPEAQAEFRREVEAVLAPFEKEGIRLHKIAFPLVEDEIRTQMVVDVRHFLLATGIFVVGVLAVAFRSPRLVLWILLSQGLALAILPAVIQWVGGGLNVFNLMVFPLVAGIHLTLLVHVASACLGAERDGKANPVAVAASRVVQSCFFAALTTIVGLLSLGLSDLAPVRGFGMTAAAGIALVFGLTFGPGLSGLALLGRKRFSWKPAAWSATAESWMRLPVRFGLRYRGLIQGVFLVLVVLMVLGLFRIRTDVKAVEFLDPASETRRTAELFNDVYGGINVVQIEFDSGRPNGVNQLSFLRYMESVQEFALAREGVSAAYSYPQLLALMNQIWEREAPGSLQLPDSPLLLNLFVLALKGTDYPFLRALCDSRFQTAYVVVRSPDMPAERYLAMLDRILQFAEARRPEGVRVSAAEGIHSILEANQRILRSQVRTAGMTVVIVGLVLAGLWRSARLPLLALAVNIVPVGGVLAVGAWVGIPLNAITVMVAAIAFGIAVDDSVHFITQWRHCRRLGQDSRTALEAACAVKAVPITVTSIILAGIFCLFQFSSFPPIRHFGALSGLAFLVAWAGVLILLPGWLVATRAVRENLTHE